MNENLLTNQAKTVSATQTYYSAVASIPNSTIPVTNYYCFLSKVDKWPQDEQPPFPTQEPAALKKIMKNIFALKKIGVNNMSPVIERIDWTSGVTYAYYKDTSDLFAQDTNGLLINRFYVKNRFDQVFKCLWNNNGQPSTTEPYFEPGTFSDNNMFQGADGYKWKYMYTIDIGLKVTFMDQNWMPVPLKSRAPDAYTTTVEGTAGAGNIEVINVLNGGSGYDPANAYITVTVSGDGIGATGTANVVNGVINDVFIGNQGTGYSTANVTITSAIGSGAIAECPPSPIGGHGSDLLGELGCSHTMLTAQFNGTESTNDVNVSLPTDVDFHQVGIIVDPTSGATTPYPANGIVYDASTQMTVALGFGSYIQDEFVYQGTADNPSYKAQVLSFDPSFNLLKVINSVGTPAVNLGLFGTVSKTARTVLGVNPPKYTTFSGYIIYIENRTSVQRSTDGIEQFKFVLGY
jgi:hypothetical protein